MFDRVYVEINNICNLNCSFCSGTARASRMMSTEEFALICEKLLTHTHNLFFHVMGEPLLHPQLGELIDCAKRFDYRVHITTNGTLLPSVGNTLLERADTVSRVSISLHALEGNSNIDGIDEYLNSVMAFGKAFSARGSYTVYRLWNLDSDSGDGLNSINGHIEAALRAAYPEEWKERYSGYRISENTFLEYDGVFVWPSQSHAEEECRGTCLGLRRQLAILADGTVVPCCLDSEGLIPLGNIFDEELDSILERDPALSIAEGFKSGFMLHPVCKKCSFARRFKKAKG